MSAQSPTPAGAWSLALLGTLTTLIGAAGLWAALDLAASGTASAGWRTVSGTVTESRVDTRIDIGGSDFGRYASSGTRTYEHRPVMRYTYTVDGVPYTSDRVRFGERNAERGEGARDRAQAEADLYPAGTHVKVFVDPGAPADAVLEPGRQPTPWMLGVGAIALAVGLGMVGLSVRLHRTIRPSP